MTLGSTAHRLAAFALLLLAATLAHAERPSLEGAEAEIVRTQAALCAQADVENKTYRPFFCPPRCDCLSFATLHYFEDYQNVTCEESPAYQFSIDGTSDWGSCTVAGCSTGGYCGESSHQSCTYGETCPAGEVCVFQVFSSECRKPCSLDGECDGSVPNLCDGVSGNACTVDGDCPLGELCRQNTCRRSCSGSGTACTASSTTVQLGNVRDADSVEAAQCGGNAINSADALECLAQIENLYSISCTTICGNGVLQAGEQCDDGNTTPGDGCDASCQVE